MRVSLKTPLQQVLDAIEAEVTTTGRFPDEIEISEADYQTLKKENDWAEFSHICGCRVSRLPLPQNRDSGTH